MREERWDGGEKDEDRELVHGVQAILPVSFAPHEAPHAWTNGFEEGRSRLGAEDAADCSHYELFAVSLAFDYVQNKKGRVP